jgi:enoyl-CoA hydratase
VVMSAVEEISGDSSTLLYDDLPAGQGVVRVVTLNRPEKRNAISTALLRGLLEALRQADRDPSVLALVLAAHGPSFCAGGDLTEFRNASDPRASMLVRARLLGEVQLLLPRLSVPVVSAVQGAALGAGAVLAIGTDMTIAGNDFALGYPELQDGAVPAVVMSSAVQLLGRKLAFEMLSTARHMTAPEAVRRGVVNQMVDNDQLLESALGVARQWASLSQQALGETKRLFYRVSELPRDAGVEAGIDVTAATWRPNWKAVRG